MSRTIERAFERSIVLKTTTTTTTRRGRARAQRVRLRCHEIDVARSPRASAACAATVARAPSSVRREVCAPRELFQTSALRRSLLPARRLNDFNLISGALRSFSLLVSKTTTPPPLPASPTRAMGPWERLIEWIRRRVARSARTTPSPAVRRCPVPPPAPPPLARAVVSTLVPIRPRRRGERRSLRTFPVVSLRPRLAFNPRPRRLSTPTDAFELHAGPSSFAPRDRASSSR